MVTSLWDTNFTTYLIQCWLSGVTFWSARLPLLYYHPIMHALEFEFYFSITWRISSNFKFVIIYYDAGFIFLLPDCCNFARRYRIAQFVILILVIGRSFLWRFLIINRYLNAGSSGAPRTKPRIKYKRNFLFYWLMTIHIAVIFSYLINVFNLNTPKSLK